jgi:hypothetical protein
MSQPAAELPFIDVHSRTVDAPAERVWDALAQVMRGWTERPLPKVLAGIGPVFARALACSDTERPAPGPGMPDSMVGFHVAVAESPSLVSFQGRHRFSRYALTFRIQPTGGSGSVIEAETRAAFPGLSGGIYKRAVIGSRGHVLVVRRMLATVKRLAEEDRG